MWIMYIYMYLFMCGMYIYVLCIYICWVYVYRCIVYIYMYVVCVYACVFVWYVCLCMCVYVHMCLCVFSFIHLSWFSVFVQRPQFSPPAEHEPELPWDFVSNEACVCGGGGAGGPRLEDSVFCVIEGGVCCGTLTPTCCGGDPQAPVALGTGKLHHSLSVAQRPPSCRPQGSSSSPGFPRTSQCQPGLPHVQGWELQAADWLLDPRGWFLSGHLLLQLSPSCGHPSTLNSGRWRDVLGNRRLERRKKGAGGEEGKRGGRRGGGSRGSCRSEGEGKRGGREGRQEWVAGPLVRGLWVTVPSFLHMVLVTLSHRASCY